MGAPHRWILIALWVPLILVQGWSDTYRMDWDPEPEAEAYRIIIENESAPGVWTTVRDEETSAPGMNVALAPGTYRYQVFARDVLQLWSTPSPWVVFQVGVPAAPPAPPASPASSGPVTPPELAPAPPEPVPPPPDAPFFSLGAGAEANFIDDTGIAIGGAVIAGCRFNRYFGAGTVLLASFGTGGVVSAAVELFIRWYILSYTHVELYLSPGIGALAAMKGADPRDSRGSVTSALELGVRVKMGRFYLEPYIRGGYPVLGGAGLRLGYVSGAVR